jgi:CO/xanthine dehydrogenase Mo-binding subunit
MATSLVPGSRAAAWALMTGARVVATLPNSLVRRVMQRAGGSFGMHDTVAVREYPELTLPAT